MFPSNTTDTNWIASMFGWIARPIVNAWNRAQVQDELMNMDDRLLADIGISRADIPAVSSGRFASTALPTPRLVAEHVSRLLKPEAPIAHNDRAEPRVA